MPIGLYLVSLEVGNVGTPGAPILHFQGTVNAPTGEINGRAEITQALPPPYDRIEIPHVTGRIRHLGFGPDKRIVSLEGTYLVTVPPPAIGAYLAHFSAVLAVDEQWNGSGEFSYSGHTVSGVPVKSLPFKQADAA